MESVEGEGLLIIKEELRMEAEVGKLTSPSNDASWRSLLWTRRSTILAYALSQSGLQCFSGANCSS